MPDLEALLDALRLKQVVRAGWGLAGVPHAESVAGHSHGVAVLTLLFLPAELSLERALAFAVLHDLAEVRTGDITPHDGIDASEKHRRESEAIASMHSELPRGSEVAELWTAYETQRCPESRFVRQLDRLDMALQAVVYARAGHCGLKPFVLSALKVIEAPELRSVATACAEEIERCA